MRPPVLGMIVLAVIFALIAVLYWVGALQVFVSHPGRHTTHAALFAVLALLSLIAANFMRSRSSA